MLEGRDGGDGGGIDLGGEEDGVVNYEGERTGGSDSDGWGSEDLFVYP